MSKQKLVINDNPIYDEIRRTMDYAFANGMTFGLRDLNALCDRWSQVALEKVEDEILYWHEIRQNRNLIIREAVKDSFNQYLL